MITVKMLDDAAAQGVHYAKGKFVQFEDRVAHELIVAGKAIRHVVNKIEGKPDAVEVETAKAAPAVETAAGRTAPESSGAPAPLTKVTDDSQEK